MLNETLVVWTTEFGRTPFNKTADHKGREHHPLGFSSWLAGGGVKRLSSRHAGLNVRLTGVEHAHVVKEILA